MGHADASEQILFYFFRHFEDFTAEIFDNTFARHRCYFIYNYNKKH